MMKEENFLEVIADILEVDVEEICMETDFRKDVKYFDSLKGFLMITMAEDDLGVQISVEQFLKFRTIGDIYNFIAEKEKE